jgi:hypothetical protein
MATVKKNYLAGQISSEEYAQRRKECADVNAGAFYVVLVNQIAKFQEGFVSDLEMKKEVWNHPIYGYEIFSEEVVVDADGKEIISKEAAPGTVREIEITLSVDYKIDWIPNAWQANTEDEGHTRAFYKLRLEVNQNDMILGGSWVENSKKQHPDFLWKQKPPQMSSFKGLEHLSFEQIQHYVGDNVFGWIEYIYYMSTHQKKESTL